MNDYYFSVEVPSNLDENFKYFQRNDDYQNWSADFEDFIYKLGLERHVENFTVYMDTSGSDHTLMVIFSNREFDIMDDTQYNAFINDRNLHKRLLEAANDMIKEVNEACKVSDLCHIPDSEFIYHNHRFFVELYKGKYLGHDQQLIFKELDNVEWDNI